MQKPFGYHFVEKLSGNSLCYFLVLSSLFLFKLNFRTSLATCFLKAKAYIIIDKNFKLCLQISLVINYLNQSSGVYCEKIYKITSPVFFRFPRHFVFYLYFIIFYVNLFYLINALQKEKSTNLKQFVNLALFF